MSAAEDGSNLVLRVIDWQAAERDFEQTVKLVPVSVHQERGTETDDIAVWPGDASAPVLGLFDDACEVVDLRVVVAEVRV